MHSIVNFSWFNFRKFNFEGVPYLWASTAFGTINKKDPDSLLVLDFLSLTTLSDTTLILGSAVVIGCCSLVALFSARSLSVKTFNLASGWSFWCCLTIWVHFPLTCEEQTLLGAKVGLGSGSGLGSTSSGAEMVKSGLAKFGVDNFLTLSNPSSEVFKVSELSLLCFFLSL